MKIQVVSLDSPHAFELYSNMYSLENIVQDSGLLALEIRGLSKGILLELQNTPVSWKHKKSDQNTVMLTGQLNALKKAAGIVKEKFPGIGSNILKFIDHYTGYEHLQYEISGKSFQFNKCYIMGILNITPDSFSDGGKYFERNAAVARGIEMIKEGADIIDLGGESTRPGAAPVSEQEEMDRVIPVIQEIIKYKADVVISVDTTKNKVAGEALLSGAGIINDISGLNFDKDIAGTAAQHNAALVVMHIKGTPQNMQKNPEYQDVVAEVYDYLYEQTELARTAGVKKIVIDPGIGFGKKIEHNFELIRRLKDFKSLGYPLMIGVSRKSFLGKYLNLETDNRDTASSITDMAALTSGARILRTHNVKYGVQVREIYNRLNANV